MSDFNVSDAYDIYGKEYCEQKEALVPVPNEKVLPGIEGAKEKICEISLKSAVEIYGDPLPLIVRHRLNYELRLIIDNGYATLYLVAQALVKKSLEDDYIVGFRGGVGSSLVAALMNITEVNPLPPHYICSGSNCYYSEFFENSPLNSGFDLADKSCPTCGAKLKKDGQMLMVE